ncbi:hypothetical protein ACDY96_14265 [Rhizobium mongolense]|uniref:hypothetical protein n=1 Tax=Rhizobium TaxID=379 RepID=UPI0024B0E788|nr:hypothetical protein [Rhizobium sp. CC1099]WFU90325.1 hypothetical protein QA644_30545 [Rhizobium sp. CC1099]
MSNRREQQTPEGAFKEKIGETTSFPYDRLTVERFRAAFPQARWSDDLKAWFVPGKTAGRRIARWRAYEATQVEAYADEKGRDAFQFDPIESPYLEVGEAGLRVRTPFSRTVVDELREVPWAYWDSDLRVWHVPFRSFDDLRRRWATIEAAARRNEPEERKRRAEERKGTEDDRRARLRSAERKRRRYPLACNDLPPLQRPVATEQYGVIVFTEITGELVEPPDTVADFYPGATDDHVWGLWRTPTLDELICTWPAKPVPENRRREWWLPSIDELRPARRLARSRERRRRK